MLRRLIAFFIFIYALAFALAALSAMRWPLVMMLAGFFGPDHIPGGMDDINWRLLGLAHGGAWLLAALCYYATAATLSGNRSGSRTWFTLALFASAPCYLLHRFTSSWQNGLSPFDGAILGGAAGAVFLYFAVREYSLSQRAQEKALTEFLLNAQMPRAAKTRPPEPAPEADLEDEQEVGDDEEEEEEDLPRIITARARKPRIGPAVLRQRQCFAAYGRRQPRRFARA